MKAAGLNNKGQIGPMSLEDIFPMVIAIIILFVFIAFIFNITGANLAQRNTEELHETALGITHILVSKSVFVYAGKDSLLDAGKLDDYSYYYNQLSEKYGVAGHNFSISVYDLEDTGRQWKYEPSSGANQNSATIALPVAIRYSVDSVHEGLLETKVWRTK